MKTSKSIEMEPENVLLHAHVGTRWFAVHTQPHREFRANQQLGNQGFTVFLPKRLKTVRHARRLPTYQRLFSLATYSFSWIYLSIVGAASTAPSVCPIW